jgi:hypothetical protein
MHVDRCALIVAIAPYHRCDVEEMEFTFSEAEAEVI